MKKLANKVAVITGGNSGIGLATAREFIELGARVIITGRNQRTLEEAQQQLGDGLHAIASDAGDLADIRALAGQVAAIAPRIDILFVNAGFGKFSPIESVDEAHFDEQFNVNVKGLYFTIQQLLPLINEGGAIILNTSVVTEMGMPGASVYSATKAAVSSFGKTLGAELAGRKIRVNVVSPGPIQTNFFDRTGMSQVEIEGFAAGVLQQVPLRRFGSPGEVAKAVAFLASDDASYVLGTEIYVDGGMSQL
ncbi:MAG: SDR family oxidoreductase [Ferruginibacter sp.]|nr:SDR family oxidoreductase [Cytophagales bacterium]